MRYDWDDAKNRNNKAKHGVGFERIAAFDWSDALVIEDVRQDYTEIRYAGYGWIEGRLFVCIHAMRGNVCRVISL
jgi:uncharacterized protein